jgi:hypothetical protein
MIKNIREFAREALKQKAKGNEFFFTADLSHQELIDLRDSAELEIKSTEEFISALERLAEATDELKGAEEQFLDAASDYLSSD